MGLILRLGLRNIGRNKVRSALTIAAVVLCSGGVTFGGSFIYGMLENFVGAVLNQTGHLRLIHEKLAEKPRLGEGVYFVRFDRALMKKLRAVKNVRAVVPRVKLGALVEHKGKNAPAGGLGIDPVAEREVLRLQDKVMKGRLIKAKGKEVMLGRVLARKINAKVGSSVVLMGRTVDDSVSAIKLKVVALLDMGNSFQNKTFVVSVATAQYLLEIPNRASSVLVFGKTVWQARRIKKEVAKLQLSKDTRVETWHDSPFAKDMVPMMTAIYGIIAAIIILVAGIGLLNTMTMSVLERRAEVGIMMALGLTPTRIAAMFLGEGVVFGGIGSVIGVCSA